MSMQTLHNLIASEAQAKSSAVFVYDTTVIQPFGSELINSPTDGNAEIFQMQSRPGAGAALVGYVESIAFTSKGAAGTIGSESSEAEAEKSSGEEVKVPSKRLSTSVATKAKKAKKAPSSDGGDNQFKTVSVLASTGSFLSLVPSLLALPEVSVRPPVVIHVSAQTGSLREAKDGSVTLEQVPDLGSLFEGIKSLEEGGFDAAVILSETAKEAANVSTCVAESLAAAGFDLISVFDGLDAGRVHSKIEATETFYASTGNRDDMLDGPIEFFTYTGSETATQVIVLPASAYSNAAKAAYESLNDNSLDVGILVVRLVKPWFDSAFLHALPGSAKTVHLYAEAGSENSAGPFHDHVLASILSDSDFNLKIKAFPVPASTLPTVQDWALRLLTVAGSTKASTLTPLSNSKFAVFWDLDGTSGETELVPSRLAKAFGEASSGVSSTLDVRYDNFKQGGIQQAALLLESSFNDKHPVSAILATSPASLLFLSSPAAVFKAYEPISTSTIGAETRIVLSANWTSEEVATKLPLSARKALVANSPGAGNLFVVDTDKLAATYSVKAVEIAEIVFWSFYLPSEISAKEIVTLLSKNPSFNTWDHAKLVEINSAVRNAIVQVNIEKSWAEEAEMVVDGAVVVETLPSVLIATSAGPNPDRTFADPTAGVIGDVKKSWHGVAHRLLFPEAFAVEQATEELYRPDLPEKNYLVTVTENRRLTPSNYDRNVFHLEFSTVGTGLKYAVGEALGIHGWNDEDEVREFLGWYGLDPEAIISTPSRIDPNGRMEQRTVFQMFQQNLDIFGKPGKSFYETLSRYATNKDQERALRFIACADGHATFKKMSENDTVTYADLLRQFPSARPSVDELVREIEAIKPRHYSIASSQNFVGDSVHLLIVTVEWNNPTGAPRYGQCTRYLNNLKLGDKVMVSVKPSVMKLPVLDTDPIIMAGLGTGAAPFRAFIQERAYQKSLGKEVGPALYYFGSRHRSKEYLYGEEIEAYMSEGVLTHAGLAFSRDTDQKVYIQHKMNEDADLLARMLETGVFYLCGPTWPVPDVYEALVKSFMSKGKTLEAAQAYIEQLKEEERYVLEVY